jgi:thioredoxin-related protein
MFSHVYLKEIEEVFRTPELAAAFGINTIPTLLFCPMGEKPQIRQGALPKETLIDIFDTVLLKQKKK